MGLLSVYVVAMLQIFMNGVTYCSMFPGSNNSLCVSGMAGGRVYEILVEVYGNKPEFRPQQSNKLVRIL